MVNLKHLLLIIFLHTSLFAFSQKGIKFTSGTWQEIVTKAKTSNKAIFLDAYTTWCGPCKAMDKKVFTQKNIGDYFNANFINVKFDMEKGDGLKLAEDNSIEIYPTYLFFDPNGDVIHKGVGYMESAEFLSLGEVAMDPERRFSSLEARYNNNDRPADLLKAYSYALKAAYSDKAEKIALEYLETQSNWSSEANMKVIMDLVSRTNTRPFKYLVKNRGLFEEKMGKEIVADVLDFGVENRIVALTNENHGEPPLKDIESLYLEILGDDGPKKFLRYRLDYHSEREQWGHFAHVAEDYITKYQVGGDEIELISWAFSEYIDNKELLEKALEWMNKAIKKDPSYSKYETLTALYVKLGKTKEAKKSAKKAIKLAQTTGEDSSEVSKMLKALKK